MDPRWRVPLAVIVGLLALAGWYFRYDIVRPSANTSAFYKVNRWTGNVEVCHTNGCRDAAPRPAE